MIIAIVQTTRGAKPYGPFEDEGAALEFVKKQAVKDDFRQGDVLPLVPPDQA